MTLQNHEGGETHVLFMLDGISTRWKQTIAYYFITDSVDGIVVERIIFEIVEIVEHLGLKVVEVSLKVLIWDLAVKRSSEFGI